MIKSEPNSEGESEIGYGIGTDYQNHGYMTEAVWSIVPLVHVRIHLITARNVSPTTGRPRYLHISCRKVNRVRRYVFDFGHIVSSTLPRPPFAERRRRRVSFPRTHFH